jgi:GNAT superfamily N-acetyltransferase
MSQHAVFRPYEAKDRAACRALFDENCPDFFAPNERAEYAEFLDSSPQGYEVCILYDQLVGAFGLHAHDSGDLAVRWIMVSRQVHGRGLGSTMMTRVLSSARSMGAKRLHIAASHKSAPFFARFGALETARITDGWGPEMHRVEMQIGF